MTAKNFEMQNTKLKINALFLNMKLMNLFQDYDTVATAVTFYRG